MKILFYRYLIGLIFLVSFSAMFSQEIEGTYAIKNRETGLLLRIKDANQKNGTPLVSYSVVNWKCVTWDFIHVSEQSYQLRNLFTGKTFQPVNQIPVDGTELEQQVLNSEQENQIFEFIPVEKNVYLIRLKGTEFYITPSEDKGIVNSSIILSNKNGSKLQQWTIYEQHPKI